MRVMIGSSLNGCALGAGPLPKGSPPPCTVSGAYGCAKTCLDVGCETYAERFGVLLSIVKAFDVFFYVSQVYLRW
jgi:hypothetical protein